MNFILADYIRDPLYRLAIWIILLQLLFIVGATLIAIFIRWIKPQIEAKLQREEKIARETLLELLSEEDDELEETKAIDLFHNLSIRSLITAFEQVVTRLGEIEQRRLRGSAIALGIENHAIKLCHSWWWWRRLEGALLLRSVGASTSEDYLVKMLNDKNPSVSFYSAWALARVSPVRGLHELISYIEREGGYLDTEDDKKKVKEEHDSIRLAFSQQVTLLKELQLEYLEAKELADLFERLSNPLKPVLIEALIQSGRGLALPIVRQGITADDIEVRIASFKAAATSKLSLTEAEVKLGLKDQIWPVRAQAVKVAAALRMINLIPNLCHCLSDGQWWVRHNSAQALVQLGAAGVEALSYVSQYSTDRFARDMAKLVLSDAIMGADPNILSTLDKQSTPSERLLAEESVILNPDANTGLHTAELSALSLSPYQK